MPGPVVSSPQFRVLLGSAADSGFNTGLSVLAGEGWENLFGAVRPRGRQDAFSLFEAPGWLVGAATVPLQGDLEEVTHRLYHVLLTVTQGWHLARIWNYVPDINEPGEGGLENYRIFCRGRSLAFEQHLGSGFKPLLPAASAVGTTSGALTVVFAASAARTQHVENPLQVAAYDYPATYGPRSPSFARASLVGGPRGTVFISGTAAIRGHATVAPDQLLPQLECTLGNLREISRVAGLTTDLGRGPGVRRFFKVYLRHAADQARAAAVLQERLLIESDQVTYLRADICRAALVVEIEATIFRA
jgi:hypothetical protein